MSEPVYSDHDLRQCAQVFKALGDETRQKILLLLKEQPLCVNRIVSHFKLAQPTISRHLAVLRQAQLVTAVRSRQQIIYHLVPGTIHRYCIEFLAAFCEQCPLKDDS